MIHIRQVTDSDVKTLINMVDTLLKELERSTKSQLSDSRLAAALQDQRWHRAAFVAEDDNGEPVGLITLTEIFAMYMSGSYGAIDELYVVPELRSSGIGRRLIAAAIEYSRQRNWPRLVVTAPDYDPGERTRGFYESVGFEFTGPKLRIVL
jgi:GNAT superfamily N-acetyltransferase